ncbi:MAG: IS66 family insertion sequence element accessory protein TnpB [Sphaerochaetaceae bacterium]
MFLDAEGYDYYLRCGTTDMRCGIQSLAYLVQETMGMDPFSKSIFLFCGGKNRILKVLVWDNGFWLMSKRLCGGTFRWPAHAGEARPVHRADVLRLISGEDIFRRIPVRQGSYGF